ncbi:stage II sporulation protein M [Prevotella sp. E13-17]|uniref:stage II sporulation protein M n=1 Tax=Prevotella sp. E13-17 TaxID=2913616 RepID=UPI001EDBB711|nr:stage II sporulation protein M [Prevotella sp. E13-17]UKK51341.1 stage II sporulation protein M [Prevotella sp. E13-17]
MKEVTFIRHNIDKWRRYEKVLEEEVFSTPDDLADAYIDVTSDLAFSQTHYPQSRITLYLNNLGISIHNKIYRNKRERWTRIYTFWTQEVPATMWDARRELRWSFLIFLMFSFVGALSQWLDPEFSRLIMGDSYVDMTLDNIAKGSPMAVYDGSTEGSMFVQITLNNVKVSFLVYVMGIFTSLGTGFLLMRNAVMLGAFQTFFAQHGLLCESALAIWLHGTLEISAIIIAGAAGLAMGNGWLFPGTYSRMDAFRRGVKRGLKIVVGTVPVFIMAGFIESFATRHVEVADALRLGIIVLSALFIVSYFIVLPYLKHHESGKTTN